MTTLIRFDPSRNLSGFQSTMHRLFDELADGPFPRTPSGLRSPAVDVLERDDALVFRAELPGLQKQDLHVEVDDKVLTIHGERKAEPETESTTYHVRERESGGFHRSFTLPATVDAEKISASLKDGILEVTLPKAEQAKARKIAIAG